MTTTSAAGFAGLRPLYWMLWQLLGLLVLVAAVGSAAAAGHRAVLPLAVTLVSTLVGWHWFAFGGRGWARYRLAMPGYALVAIGLVVALIWLDPIFQMVLFVLYTHLHLVLPKRWATGYATLLTVLLVIRGVVRQPALTPAWFVIGTLALLFGVVFTLWICAAAAQQRATGVLAERTRLAREIHDTLAQGFASVVTHLEAAEERMAGGRSENSQAALAHHLVVAKQTARDNLTEARRLVAALRPQPLETGSLPGAVGQLAARWSAQTGVPVRVATPPAVGVVRPEVEVALLRVVQEALTNVARHAGARSVVVELGYPGAQVRLAVRDDGAGFDPSAVPAGFGLEGMRERLAALGGELTVSSAPGAGTTVRARVPVTSRG